MEIFYDKSTGISIHAPREGGDVPADAGRRAEEKHFNPRPPRGGRPRHVISTVVGEHFNPRPPRGGRRVGQAVVLPLLRFQSTPPARGATAAGGRLQALSRDFNPRPPRGGRPWWRA